MAAITITICKMKTSSFIPLVLLSFIWCEMFILPTAGQTSQAPEESCPVGCHCAFETRTVTCQPSMFSSIPTNFPSYTTTLFLRNNYITSIPENSFLALPNLVELDLSLCQIQTIDPGAFNGLSHLRILKLTGNFLATLSPGAFTGLGSLRELNLERNFLQIIPGNVFQDTANLQVLTVNNNPVLQITDDAFANVSSLVALYIEYGQLQEVPQIALQDLINLKILSLSGNPITALPSKVFATLASLDQLKLDNMELLTVGDESFSGLQALTKLDLAYNNLRSLDPVAFQDLTTLESIILTGNLWNCVCQLLPFIQWLQDREILYYSTSWYCVEPSNLNGKVVYTLQPREFACEPVITTAPIDTDVRYQTQVAFECYAIGDPTPTIQWYRPDGTQVLATSNTENIYTAVQGSVLIIQFVNEDLGGVYNCTASNARGSESALFLVRVIPEVSTAGTDSDSSTDLDRTTQTQAEADRVGCFSFTLDLRLELITETSISISWNPYNGDERLNGYIVQSHFFGDEQTNSYYVNWTQSNYELMSLFSNTDYTVCAAYLLEGCPLLIPREQCKEVTTLGEDPILSALKNKHRNEIIGTVLACCLGTLFLMASVFLILWRYRKPKKYSHYDFKGNKDTAAFADIPDDIEGHGIIVAEHSEKAPATSYDNHGAEVHAYDNIYVNGPTMGKECNGSAKDHSADVHQDILQPPAEYVNSEMSPKEDSDVTDTTASMKSSSTALSDEDNEKQPREPKDKRSKVKKSQNSLSSDESMEMTDIGDSPNTDGDIPTGIEVEVV